MEEKHPDVSIFSLSSQHFCLLKPHVVLKSVNDMVFKDVCIKRPIVGSLNEPNGFEFGFLGSFNFSKSVSSLFFMMIRMKLSTNSMP